ncbi:23S rRNA pseudouridine(1911/1915/1917) synthase RluD [Candidatus Berkiella aquae]|uniref:Pseudouridine synthase n=1 Tax=Candidatus Berkiella aquae TaxID=295108 RepID=A0A0Q9YL31_9GAMM|nr:23S rRNA pseudouridine(1911/1915/1917) synthase RluD [Candidatus Berkiella aquae]MCS5710981.1 23S rRNA pseudouridine(1911/1915/1917) synthase RluD [Candidatus Berkiella aquae]
MPDNELIDLTTSVPEDYRGLRLDVVLAKCFPEHSRSRLAEWVKQSKVSLNGKVVSEPKAKVQGGEMLALKTELYPAQNDSPESIPLNIVYEDDDILVVNKPAGLVVHPAAGNRQGTLLNALLYHAPSLNHLPRAGIVHRLDKETTGLMVVAKTLAAHTALVAAMQRREIEREYLAVVAEELIAGGTIDAPIGRHPHYRTKMAVVNGGKPARTHYRCKMRYRGFTLLEVKLETGRTHQIRVHFAHQGLPLVGDTVYGWRYKLPPQSTPELQQQLLAFKRQALHAWRLSLQHPVRGEKLTWEAPLPEDFANLLKCFTKK